MSEIRLKRALVEIFFIAPVTPMKFKQPKIDPGMMFCTDNNSGKMVENHPDE